MNEPGITPLAKRLAEENNVDWRSLPASGSDGRIVERDVLSYLARVMAGDEALDPTPEPVPEGMEAWPDSDGFAADRVQASDAEDFGTAVVFDAAAAEEQYDSPGFEPEVPEPAATGDALELSEDIFLFGDGDEDSLELPDVLSTGASAAFGTDEHDSGRPLWDDSDDEGFDDESLLVIEDDDFFGLADGSDQDEGASPGFEGLTTESEEDFGSGSEDWNLEDDSLGFSVEPEEGLLGRTDDLLDDSEFEDADLTDLAMEDGELDDPRLADDNLRAFEGTLGGHEESLESQAGLDGPDSAPEPEEDFDVDFSRLSGWDEGDDPVSEDDDLLQDDFLLEETEAARGYEAEFAAALREAAADEEADEGGTFALTGSDDGRTDLEDDLEPELSQPDEGQPDEDQLSDAHLDEAEPDVAQLYEAQLYEAQPDEAQPDEGQRYEERPDRDEEKLDEEQLDLAPVAGMAPGRGVPLADFGTLLRRRLDVTQLSQAQQAVARELDLDGARSALPFLLRAATRALGQVPLVPSGGTVAAAVIAGGHVSLVAGRDSGFRELAGQLGGAGAEAAGDADDAVLAVADMSSYEVDEAVLNLGMPVLTLGRALHDAETGTFRSTLTLSGHYDLEEGARFLQAASELLSQPLTLLI